MRLFCRHRWMYKHTAVIGGVVYATVRCARCHEYRKIRLGEEYDLHGH